MAFVAGIDEAGYGPLLGPLVVGYSLFRVPHAGTDLWQVCRTSAQRRPGRTSRAVAVDDSKRVHGGGRGRARLERSVAAFRALLGDDAALRSWLEQPPAPASFWFEAAPWYGGLPGALCPAVPRARTRLDAAALARELDRGGCSLAGFGARCAPETEWNALLQRLSGKGAALFALNAELLGHLLAVTGDAPLRVELDRHGGRLRYGEMLARALAPERVEVHGETAATSLYTLHFGRRKIQVRFSEGADLAHFPVALASLAAKQTRERLMDLWNDWFGARLPDLRPTRGYALDGRRWLRDAGGGLRALGLGPEALLRQR